MNDRIVIHPPKKASDNTYTLTVSYYVSGNRKQIRRSKIKTSKEAKALGETIKSNLEEEMPVIKATGNSDMTLRKFADEYKIIKSSEWAHRTTLERMRSLNHCDFADKPLTKITLLEIEKNIAKLNLSYKYNTVNSILSSWNVFLNAAVKYDYLLKNPNTAVLSKPKIIKEVNALTINEAAALTDKLEDQDMRLLTMIGYMCGLRRGEAIDLNLSDFDFKKGTVSISHQYGNTDSGWMRGRPLKTNNSYRTIPVPNKLLLEIKKRPVLGLNGEIFTRRLLNLPQYTAKKYKKLGYDITFHAMRHTYITNLILSNQFDIQSVAKLAGDTVKTVLSTYSHYLEQKQEENAVKINSLFG